MSGGQKINDHSFWAGGKSKESIAPMGVKSKMQATPTGAGDLSKYEDTQEAIKSAQDESIRKAKAHSSKPQYRN